jgi:hypothetical protein
MAHQYSVNVLFKEIPKDGKPVKRKAQTLAQAREVAKKLVRRYESKIEGVAIVKQTMAGSKIMGQKVVQRVKPRTQSLGKIKPIESVKEFTSAAEGQGKKYKEYLIMNGLAAYDIAAKALITYNGNRRVYAKGPKGAQLYEFFVIKRSRLRKGDGTSWQDYSYENLKVVESATGITAEQARKKVAAARKKYKK